MATTVTYKNNTLVTVNNQTKTLKTAGKYLEDDITLVDISGGVEAVSIVDTPDAAGGTVRTVTAVNISDTTAEAADVASGKYFYTANGTKTLGTASSGGVERTSGTLTFETRTAWAGYTLDVGIDAAQFAIYATTNPLQSNGRTFQGTFIDLATSTAKGGLWVSSNAAGGASSGSFISNSSNVSKSGTVLTFKGGSSDYFQAGITYQWYAWGAAT